MKKRGKKEVIRTRRSVPRKTAERSSAHPFVLAPETDPVIRLLCRIVLRDIPCRSCGQVFHSAFVPSRVVPDLNGEVQEVFERSPFDPTVYLPVFGGEEAAPPSSMVALRLAAAAPSAHLVHVARAEAEAARVRPRASASFLASAEIPSRISTSLKHSIEFLLPSMNERLKEQWKIAPGILRVGGEGFKETMERIDGARSSLSDVALAFRSASGFSDRETDVLPVFEDARVPRSVAFASGVPKNLPWVEEAESAPVSHISFPARAWSAVREPLLDRWERIHERLLENFRRPSASWRGAASFAVLGTLILGLPVGAVGVKTKADALKSTIVDSGKNGINAFLAASKTLVDDPGRAAEEFAKAQVSFHEATSALETAPALLRAAAAAIPGVRAGEELLVAANELAAAGTELSAAFGSRQSLLFTLASLTAAAERAGPSIARAETALRALDPSAIPVASAATFETIGQTVGDVHDAVDDLPETLRALGKILGRDGVRRYLVVFQNANELRATGGFAGSIAEITIDRGAIREVRVPGGGSYDLQGDLRAAVLPPAPLRRVTGKWQFHDANWFPDFPTSAEKLAWFYQKGGGPSVDGVIAITSDLLPELLRLLGPVAMPEYRRTLTAENVIEETQSIVESAESRETNRPKKMIGDLLEVLFVRMTDLPKDQLIKVAGTLGTALEQKTIQTFFFDEDVAAVADRAGWNGKFQNGGDRLMIVDTNIGGGKTDGVVEKRASLKAAIGADGSITNDLTLSYAHHGVPSDPLTGETYRSYVRLYVPEGSRLLDARGDFSAPPAEDFEEADPSFARDPELSISIEQSRKGPGQADVWNELGRTVFGHWVTLEPGETAVVRFRYTSGVQLELKTGTVLAKLNRGGVASYRFYLEKQAGAKRLVETSVKVDPVWASAWASPSMNGIVPSPTPFTEDRFYGMVLRKQ